MSLANKVKLLVCSAAVLVGANAHALITTTGPFTGAISETWESFNNYGVGNPNFYLNSPTDIMGGNATISNPIMAVYQPGVADFGLSGNGTAETSDGIKAMGLDGSNQTATINFDAPVFSFGGYFGGTGPDITVSFSDGSFDIFSYSRPGDGVLEWHGWTSTVGLTSVTISGDFVVMDGLQANAVSSVPESGSTMALLGFAFAGVATLRRKLAK